MTNSETFDPDSPPVGGGPDDDGFLGSNALGNFNGTTVSQPVFADPNFPVGGDVFGGDSPMLEGAGVLIDPATGQILVPARYRAGDEWTPVGLSPAEVVQLQSLMVSAGIIGEDDLQWGAWDQSAAGSYRDVLEVANISGLSPQQVLERWSSLSDKFGRGRGGGGRKLPKPTITLTDPERIASVADATARSILGRGLSDEERQSVTSALQQQERSFQMGVANAQINGTGGTFTRPDFEAQAERQLREENPIEAGGMELTNVMLTLRDAMSTPGLF